MPIMNPPRQFLGLDKLPPLVRVLVERAFSQDSTQVPAIAMTSMPNPVAAELGGVQTAAHSPEVWKRLQEVFRAKNLENVLPTQPSQVPADTFKPAIKEALGAYKSRIGELLGKK